jgi:hypothetical protein
VEIAIQGLNPKKKENTLSSSLVRCKFQQRENGIPKVLPSSLTDPAGQKKPLAQNPPAEDMPVDGQNRPEN